MSTINDGGPMFPIPDREFANGNWIYGHSGASLRDWFAGQALAGAMANHIVLQHLNEKTCTQDMAKMSYQIADAMLEARGQ